MGGRHSNPGPGYICKICGIPGHWIQQCPQRTGFTPSAQPQTKKPPGPGYICKICRQPGHWFQDCPNQGAALGSSPPGGRPKIFAQTPGAGYVCKICGLPGHWIQECPKRHEPGFERKVQPLGRGGGFSPTVTSPPDRSIPKHVGADYMVGAQAILDAHGPLGAPKPQQQQQQQVASRRFDVSNRA